ncbi:MAG: hypothetical protein RIE08_08390 [Acidimicrobiales bacterium]
MAGVTLDRTGSSRIPLIPRSRRVALRLERVREASAESWISAVVVAGCCLFVFWQLEPQLLLRDTTPAGGDMGAHVWGPAFLRDELLPRFRLSGWSPDWYAGFPAFHFYMVIPALVIAVLSFVVPYGVAFKLVAVAGVVSLPLSAWALGRLTRAPFPVPPLLALFSLFFLFDRFYWIWGGNVASTLAGEFAFSISLSLALVTIGVMYRGCAEGRYRVLAAVLAALTVLTHLIPAIFMAVCALVLALTDTRRRRIEWFVVVAVLSACLSAFWILPFWWRRAYFNDMGWRKVTAYWPNLFRDDLWWVYALASVGVVVAILGGSRLARLLAVVAAVYGLAFRFAPQGRLWNARLLPFYYLCLVLLAAIAIGLVVRALTGGPSLLAGRDGTGPSRRRLAAALSVPAAAVAVLIDDVAFNGVIARVVLEVLMGADGVEARRLQGQMTDPASWVAQGAVAGAVVELVRVIPVSGRLVRRSRSAALGALAVTALVVVGAVAIPLHSLGGFGDTDADGRYGVALPGTDAVAFGTASSSFVPSWARWNFSGYEGKAANAAGGGYLEYHAVVTTMERIGETRGCGRAMWEYDKDVLDSYGTPMSLMLLPHWTDGCIGSMEGLYFESSATVPYHFLVQSELSASPSRAMRDIPYGPFDIDRGVAHLRELGVRYHLAVSDRAISEARADSDLVEIDRAGAWVVFEVSGSELVSALDADPVVVEGIDGSADSWLDVGVEAFVASTDVVIAADGPDEWRRVEVSQLGAVLDAAPPPPAYRDVSVSDIETDTDRVSFVVDEVGVPVVVRVSYFPNWEVDGAEGPWRIAPNLMVVVPTDTNVTLRYGWTGIDAAAYLVTGLGIVTALGLARRPDVLAWGLRDTPDADPVPDPDPDPDADPNPDPDPDPDADPNPDPDPVLP